MEENICTICGEGEIYYNQELYPFQNETYKIIGACMTVHNELGRGFNEIICKDALEIEFQFQEISYQREKEYLVFYKGLQLKHSYHADFVAYDNIIIEVKATKDSIDSFYKQTINYLKVSKLSIGLIVNFGDDKLNYKRVIFSN